MGPNQSEASVDAGRAAPASILVVEDESIVARDLAGALVELGYTVPATVATGEDAIARACELRPDVVLMDIRLKGAIDGIQAASKIRERHDIPVIYLTAHSDEETLRSAMQAEPLGYLVKPFSLPQLRCAIEIALRRRAVNARLREHQQWVATTLRCVDDPAALERRVAERIADLEAANRELECFTNAVARDLREPLQGIDGLSRLLIEDYAGKLGPEGLRTLKLVREAAGRMRQVIDDVLLLSIDDLLLMSHVARAEPCWDTIDLSGIAMDVVARLRESCPQRTVKVVIEKGVRVDGDASLLRIALENLLGNAWKFTGQVEHPRIEFGAIEKNGARICFVRDNGAGFDVNHVNQLFLAFERLDSDDPFEGHGLGLGIVQRVIGKHGGRVWAEGAVGQGATFYFAI